MVLFLFLLNNFRNQRSERCILSNGFFFVFTQILCVLFFYFEWINRSPIFEMMVYFFVHFLLTSDDLFCIWFAENRYKHEAMVDGEPVLFEILDTCPKVVLYIFTCYFFFFHFVHLYRKIHQPFELIYGVIFNFALRFFLFFFSLSLGKICFTDGGKWNHKHSIRRNSMGWWNIIGVLDNWSAIVQLHKTGKNWNPVRHSVFIGGKQSRHDPLAASELRGGRYSGQRFWL